MFEITYKTALEIVTHEAIVRQTYYDGGGVPTWSVGLTSATGHKVERYWKSPQSLDHCLRVYIWALNNYADEVRKAFVGCALTEAEFAAALSFHWNTGKISEASWVKSFKAGKIGDAKAQFMLYDKPASIIDRRRAECALFFEGIWKGNGKVTEWTRVKSDGHIDWSSAKIIDISTELRAAIAGDIPASDKVIVEEKVPVPVPVTPPSHDAPWYTSKEVVAPLVSAGGIGAISSMFEKFGGIPVANLIVIMTFGAFALAAVLYYFKKRDVKAVKDEVKNL
jgi:lysozyme